MMNSRSWPGEEGRKRRSRLNMCWTAKSEAEAMLRSNQELVYGGPRMCAKEPGT